jgi:hypothetical protein
MSGSKDITPVPVGLVDQYFDTTFIELDSKVTEMRDKMVKNVKYKLLLCLG